ncbi:UDP-glycosyltransferase 79B30-like [Chenopodium quinoa]|uniref:UDP-glycosyltransferase 79B30-like n=1 Tax=Chenopodium quinoa TaxID=63459 RepID=UPI000B76BB79|nr:UDP-glycosyltransferase 79B30-like [Chenopodium quinoa]
MDMTRDTIDIHLANFKPDFVFFDMPLWVPELARKHGSKPIYFTLPSLINFAYFSLQARNLPNDHYFIEADLCRPPPGFPCQAIRLHPHEARVLASMCNGVILRGMRFLDKLSFAMRETDAIVTETCREMEGAYCDFVEKLIGKPVLLAGPVLSKPATSRLDHQFDCWLNGFSHGSVVFCALGSECILGKEQLHELVLGLELTGKHKILANLIYNINI